MQRKLHLLIIYICTVILIVIPTSANCQFNPNSDINGFSLTMTQGQVLNYVKKEYSTDRFIMMPVEIVTNDYRVNTNLGLQIDIKPYQPNELGRDRVKIFFNPNLASTDIFAIYRWVHFGVNNRITMATLFDSLVEKYGPPTNVHWDIHHWDVDYIWSGNGATSDLSTFPCYVNSWTGNASLLKQDSEAIAHNFLSYVNHNQIDNRNATRRNRGLMLTVHISSQLGAHAYAYEMEETLIDLTKGMPELLSFSIDIFTKSNQIRNQKISHDMKNKPIL